MAARMDWTRWTWPLALALVAMPVGVLAGYKPELAILFAFGLAFLLIVFADLANGVVLFTLIIFFETIPWRIGKPHQGGRRPPGARLVGDPGDPH